MTKTVAELTVEINAARAAQDWDLCERLNDERRCAEIDADEVMLDDPTFTGDDPFDSSNDTAEQFRYRAIRLRAMGYINAAEECDDEAARLEKAK